MRFNDGAIDPAGRFFAGTMTDPALNDPINEGTLFRLDSDRSLHRVLSPVHIPNGIGWSADGKTMYFTDSPTHTIWAFDYDVATAAMTNRRPWFELKGEGDGVEPDGLALDEKGDLWSAVYGAGKVIRIRDVEGKGTVVGVVNFPTRCTTCPRFVGTELVVTSAKDDGMGGDDQRSRETEGRLFRVEVGVKGAKIGQWKGRA